MSDFCIPAWIKEAAKEIGIHEGIGAKDNPKVLDYYVEAGSPQKHDSIPWCAAFVGAMLHRGGIKGSGQLLAHSYALWGQPLVNNEPVFGCVGVISKNANNHTGFVVGMDHNGNIQLLGGNQRDQVNTSLFKRETFIAFRWPANLDVPVNLPLLPRRSQDLNDILKTSHH